MIKIDDKLYDWKVACPLIISLLAYKKVKKEFIFNLRILASSRRSIT